MKTSHIRVLLCEDDPNLGKLLSDYLNAKGFAATWAQDGAEGLKLFHRETFDFIILDVMMPRKDGFEVATEIRKESKQIPILFLSARGMKEDTLEGFKVGADDYISKPVTPRLLLARISAMLRRSSKLKAASDTIGLQEPTDARHHFGSLIIDNSMREAWLGGEDIDLTSAEFDLLWLLASNAGRVLSREEIFSALRGISYNGQDRSIDVRVSRIRSKIGDDPEHPRRIKTVRSRGYLFVKEN